MPPITDFHLCNPQYLMSYHHLKVRIEAKRGLGIVVDHPEFEKALSETDLSKKELENAKKPLDALREDKKNPFAR